MISLIDYVMYIVGWISDQIYKSYKFHIEGIRFDGSVRTHFKFISTLAWSQLRWGTDAGAGYTCYVGGSVAKWILIPFPYHAIHGQWTWNGFHWRTEWELSLGSGIAIIIPRYITSSLELLYYHDKINKCRRNMESERTCPRRNIHVWHMGYVPALSAQSFYGKLLKYRSVKKKTRKCNIRRQRRSVII